MRQFIRLSLLVALGASTSAMAQSFDFSTPVVTGPTEAPGVWYTDRYAPSNFQTASGKLIESIAASDLQSIGFYNTQGRDYDLNPGVHSLSIDLTIDQSWANTNKRWAGLWGFGTAVDGSHNTADRTAYPVLEFTTDGGVARFRGFDSSGSGSWIDIIPLGGVTFGNTYTLSIKQLGDYITYSVGGATAAFTSDVPVASITTAALQGYNTGTSYSITWDNFLASSNVPESATWMMMIGGFGMVGAAMRRRHKTTIAA